MSSLPSPLFRDALRRMPLFAASTDAELTRLVAVGDERRYEPGEVLITEGATSTAVLVILGGMAVESRRRQVVLDVGPGDIVGVTLFVGDRLPSATTVVARTAVCAVAFDTDAVWTVLGHSATAWGIAQQLSERLTAVLVSAIPERTDPYDARRASTAWLSVTPAERAVVRLVTLGLTNRQIAERLHRSHYTVETHLKRVFTKLGVSSRTALTAYLRAHALDALQ